uniref:G_PROTEIN_RECEP_F1_2 domain-containing protein n=1 Tax=Meloidogyne incognita TaxID=6306 RepID=A0A914MV40_MELIC
MNETQCIDAEASVRDTLFNIVRVFHIIFGIIIVVMVIRNVWSYKTKSLKFHTNLIILISNILIIYLLLTLSYIVEAFNNFLILFTYSNPCDCLIQVWLVYLIRIPDYLYILGSPLFHFVLMTERVLATIFVKIYDKQGKLFGVTATIILV